MRPFVEDRFAAVSAFYRHSANLEGRNDAVSLNLALHSHVGASRSVILHGNFSEAGFAMASAFTNADRHSFPDSEPTRAAEELEHRRPLRFHVAGHVENRIDAPHHGPLPAAARSPSGGVEPDDVLREALLDEAADIEVHPDELEAGQQFFDESDDPQRYCELARKALHQSPYRELRRLNIRVSEDRIAILGQTTSFFLKQMAQEVIRQVAPTLVVDNLIGVRHLPCHYAPPQH
jgi:hypothetical protein